MTADPRAEYTRRIQAWDREIARGDRRHAIFSNTRLILAAAMAVLGWQALVNRTVSPAWPLGLAAVFAGVAIAHARMLGRMERARRARTLYERGLARLDSTWAGSGPDGHRFLDSRALARDLDLFGAGSLFQLLHTVRTEAGEDTLADWLTDGAPPAEIRLRQEAVAELKPHVSFREDLAVLAAEAHVGRTGALASWAAAGPAGLGTRHSMLFAAGAAVGIALVALVVAGMLPASMLLVWILVALGVAGIWHRKIHTVIARLGSPADDLQLLSGLLSRIERESFRSARLRAIRDALRVAGVPPSRRIRTFQRLVTLLDQSTKNQFFVPIALVLLLRAQAAAAIDRWHAAYGTAVGEWLRAVGEMEALSALATYGYEHPVDPFPAIVETGVVFEATGLAHPLLDQRVAVSNDVRLGGPHPQALIVSGSNMSGKSTLLRSVGVNVVLARAGAPVRATSAVLSPLEVGATIRIDDSLREGQSRFYAEILRLRSIVSDARGSRPVVFLLDEILGGTNSYDRRIGAEAILRALVDAGAIGLMTTHDLALTELAGSLSPRVENVHFEDRIENGAMVFDYRMRSGVVQRSNAIALMRAVGLDV